MTAVRCLSLSLCAALFRFINLDRVIKAVNANSTIKIQYSTPSLYVKAKNQEQVQWPTKTDDYVSTETHTRPRCTPSRRHTR